MPNTAKEQKKILDIIGLSSCAELFDTIPSSLCLKDDLNLPEPLSEMELLRQAKILANADCNAQEMACFLGAGIYDHYIPATVPAVVGRSEFYTAYTPYQPELSQGNLQAIFEFQTLVCQLTGMEVANASMYDCATGLAEAAMMASSITGRSKWVTTTCVHPSYRETLKTYAWASGFQLTEIERQGLLSNMETMISAIDDGTACVIVQSPNFFGSVESVAELSAAAHDKGALLIYCFNPISLGLLNPPAMYDADICVGEGQPLGVPMSFGGPLLGLFACRKEHLRQMPGRLVGATVDHEQRRGYTLTLQTREQHIKRERATSNICTNEALCALAATVYLSTVGKNGLAEVANQCFQKAHYAAERIAEADGLEVLEDRFFHEFVVKVPGSVSEMNRKLSGKGIIGGLDLERFYPDLKGHMLLCVTEKRTKEEIDVLVGGLAE